MLELSAEQVDAVFANPVALFMAPELAAFAEALAVAKQERDKSLATSDCQSCHATVRARYQLWYQQQWLPQFTQALNASDSVRSVVVTLLQANNLCPA